MPERPRFYEWMTVSEIGWFTSSFHKNGFLRRYNETSRKLGLDLKKRLRDLSKGGYARVALALALAPDPEVLILDEPTSGLDLLTRRDFLSSLVELAANGRTIFISSHGISELERIASHVGLLNHGRLLFSGPTDDVKKRFTRILLRTQGDLPDVSRLGNVLHRQTLGKQVELLIEDAVAGCRRPTTRRTGNQRTRRIDSRTGRHLRGRHAQRGSAHRGDSSMIFAIVWKEWREQTIHCLDGARVWRARTRPDRAIRRTDALRNAG